jgi:hypothetical protein
MREREYSYALVEIAEGIRALYPNAGNQPSSNTEQLEPVSEPYKLNSPHFDTVALEVAR